MFGRGQLELGTDTVQCQGESNGQAEVPGDGCCIADVDADV